MPLAKLQFRPGINRESTSYANEGGWFDCDKVRFHQGYPEKFGGWEKYSSSTYLGTARALHNWIALDGSNYMGVGTELKYYIEEGGGYNDITPIRSTTSAGDVTFSATDGSTTITVSDTDHGAGENDFVTFSGAVTLGGVITADVLNQEYQIVSIVDADTYTITSAVAANASDSGNGGASVVGEYQINVGLNTQVGGTGWGAGTWSRGAWGSAATVGTTTELRLWSHDNFGEDLLMCPRDSSIYYWDKSSTLSARAVEIGTLSGASNTPTIAKQVLVSDNDRHVIAFGCNPLGSSDQDNLLIRFSDQESLTDWTPTATNTAGDLRLGSGSEFIQAVETKREVLVWTDKTLHSMRYVGPPFTFGITQLASSITIVSPKAAVAAEDFVFWMGIDNFYVYDGRTANLPCTVRDYVFEDFNSAQAEKVFGGINTQWGEVIWFYPSSTSDENDRYVVFNYLEKVWYYGNLSRTAWRDRGLRPFPMAAGASGGSSYLYNHEIGADDDGSAMEAYIESSQIDIGDGEKFLLINRLIPDLTFTGSTNGTPVANFTLETREYPGAAYDTITSGAVTRSATSPVEQFTNQLDMRLRGRSFAIKVDSDALGTRWRLGAPRVGLREDGRR
jgi:hypothetical protein